MMNGSGKVGPIGKTAPKINVKAEASLKGLLGPRFSSPQLINGLLGAFELSNGVFTSIQYNGKSPFDINGRRYCYPGQKNSKLIIGTTKDLSYYPVDNIIHPDEKDPKPVTYLYLDKYLLIPTSSGKLVFVSDTHQHALFGWALSNHLGLTDAESALIHIDEHRDNTILNNTQFNLDPTKGKAKTDLNTVALMCQNCFDIYNFMEDTVGQTYRGMWGKPTDGFFYQVFYVMPQDSGSDHTHEYYGNERGIGGLRTSIENIPKQIERLKRAGKKVIVDIDLDYFAVFFNESLKIKPEDVQMSYEQNLELVKKIVREADFITIATSPEWFASQQTHARNILEDIVQSLQK